MLNVTRAGVRVITGTAAAVGLAAVGVLAPSASSAGTASGGGGGAVVPICWGINDDTTELLRFSLSKVNPLPPSLTQLSQLYVGEGMAYRASTHSLAIFTSPPVGSTSPPSRLWYYDLATGAETPTANPLPGHVDAATFWVNPADPNHEELFIVIGDELYQLDPDTGAVIDGPHVLPGIGGSSGGMAVDPKTGELWMTDDWPEAALYRIERPGFVAHKVVDIRWPDGGRPDAEALDFGAQGQLYTEEDRGDHKGQRVILEIDKATGFVTPVAGPIPGIGDLEGLGCNGGAEVFQPVDPSIDLQKYVNGEDADLPPGPDVPSNTNAFFRYLVTNTGNLPLRDVVVVDDRGVAVVCPAGANVIPLLGVGEFIECVGASAAEPNPYVNIGSVTGWADPPPQPDDLTPSPIQVIDDDPAHYHGYQWPPATTIPSVETTTDLPTSSTRFIDPEPSYGFPERIISQDSLPPSVPAEVTLPETGGSGGGSATVLAAAFACLAGAVLMRVSRRPSRR